MADRPTRATFSARWGNSESALAVVPCVQPGDQVEDFTLPDEEGRPVQLSTLWADGPVVLFFYPAAMTPGCTAESCHFRDLAGEFAAIGAQRVGISADAVAKQREFSELHRFDFPLLSDPDGTIARRFGVRRALGPLKTKRWTFVIDRGGRLRAVIKSETRMNRHADRALEVLSGSR
jgi:thioredoxin-dependent peroxiredoxin